MAEKITDRTTLKQALTDLGWSHADNQFAHPSNPDLNIWVHPYDGTVLLSPQLVEHLKSLAPVINLLREPSE